MAATPEDDALPQRPNHVLMLGLVATHHGLVAPGPGMDHVRNYLGSVISGGMSGGKPIGAPKSPARRGGGTRMRRRSVRPVVSVRSSPLPQEI